MKTKKMKMTDLNGSTLSVQSVDQDYESTSRYLSLSTDFRVLLPPSKVLRLREYLDRWLVWAEKHRKIGVKPSHEHESDNT